MRKHKKRTRVFCVFFLFWLIQKNNFILRAVFIVEHRWEQGNANYNKSTDDDMVRRVFGTNCFARRIRIIANCMANRSFLSSHTAALFNSLSFSFSLALYQSVLIVDSARSISDTYVVAMNHE